MREH
jgi:hypothetical protein